MREETGRGARKGREARSLLRFLSDQRRYPVFHIIRSSAPSGPLLNPLTLGVQLPRRELAAGVGMAQAVEARPQQRVVRGGLGAVQAAAAAAEGTAEEVKAVP